MPASGRHSHKEHRGKREKYVAHTCFELQPCFCSQSCGVKYRLIINVNGANRWPGWILMKLFDPLHAAISNFHFYTRVAG